MSPDAEREIIMRLMKKTFSGYEHCEQALLKTNWDFDKAVEVVKQEVIDHAQKKDK